MAGAGAGISVLSMGTSTFVNTTSAAATTVVKRMPLRRLRNGRSGPHSFFVQIDDPVHIDWTLRENDGGAPPASMIQQRFEGEFRFGVHAGARLIQNEDRRILEKGAGRS